MLNVTDISVLMKVKPVNNEKIIVELNLPAIFLLTTKT